MNELETAAQYIASATSPEDIFGLISPSDDPLKAIAEAYHKIVRAVHPDHYKTKKEADLAREAFAKLTSFKAMAEAKIKRGTYGDRKTPVETTPVAGTDPLLVEVEGKRYVLTEIVSEGDLCTLYACSHSDAKRRCAPAIFKVVGDEQNNDLLEREAAVLGKLTSGKDPTPIKGYVPLLLDTLKLPDQRRANILPNFEGFYSLQEVLAAYPKGIDYRDMAWMLNRMLEGIGFVHAKNVVHGAILPPHVLIHPKDHGAKIIDWCYSIDITPKPAAKKARPDLWDFLSSDEKAHVPAIVPDYKDFYPPEILAKDEPTPATDIYMIARCAVALLNGNKEKDAAPGCVPAPIRSLLRDCLQEDSKARPQKAWDVRDKFEEILASVVGKRTYRDFKMV